MAEERDDGVNVEEALLGSVPARPALTPEVLAELSAMARNARTASAPSKIRGRLSRGAAAGLATVVIGGVGAAAALTGHSLIASVSQPEWQAEPDAEMTFAGPDGEVCNALIGNYQSNDPALNAVIDNIFATVDVADLIDVESAIEEARQKETVGVDERGQEVPGGYGTKYYPDLESEYQLAVVSEMMRVIREELKRLGYTADQLNELGPIASSDCDEAP